MKIENDIQHAVKFDDWIKNRGGIAHWQSIDLSDPGASCSTPARTETGEPYPKPHCKYSNEPSYIVTDPDRVFLTVSKEVRRFRVAVRRGAQGFKIKCTDFASRKIENTLDKLGKDAFYEFDYSTQEAVFFIPHLTITLSQWRVQHDRIPS